jgi:alpha-beta hydrolase superfamily lysophospholipase
VVEGQHFFRRAGVAIKHHDFLEERAGVLVFSHGAPETPQSTRQLLLASEFNSQQFVTKGFTAIR